MVGVPGRSKGCKGCRRRKKACSLTKPVCDLCKRLNENCNYDRDTIFISVGETTWRQATYSVGRNHTALPHASVKEPPGSKLALGNNQLIRVAFREQLLAKYLQVHHTTTRPTLASWLSVLPSVGGPGGALETAAYAICTSRLGQLHDDPVLTHESLRLYALGVRQLHMSLRDPTRLRSDQTLGACIALALYEILEGERDVYAKHADGAAHLIQLRGPKRHRTGLGHIMFLGYRFIGTLRAMEKKEPTFLGRKEWITIPWESAPKSSFDKLLDLVTQAPEIIQRGDEIESLPFHCQYKAGAELFRDCARLYNQIQEFHDLMIKDAVNPLYWPTLVDDELVVRYEFANVDTAAILVMIWAYSLMLEGGLTALATMLNHFQELAGIKPIKKFELLGGEHLGELAQHILRSVDYCIKKSDVEVRSPVIMAPLAIVIDVLKHWPQYQEQYLAARHALQGISKLGFKMVWPPPGETPEPESIGP